MNPRLVFWIDLVTALGASALLWAMLSPKAEAAELILHGPSHHFDSQAGYNNQNFGLGYAFDNNIVVGAYDNSIRRTSVYAGYVLRLTEHVGILAGVATGYEKMPVQPAALLIFTAPITGHWLLHFNVAPVKGGFINLSLGYRR
jgi:hypothetical protein